MGASKKLKKAMIDKKVTQVTLAEMTGKNLQALRNMFYRDNMTYATIEQLADALGCDVVLQDRETGEIYR